MKTYAKIMEIENKHPTHSGIESNGYRMLGIADVMQQPIEVGWLVEDLIPLQSVGMVFGASGLGS